ncbi:MAG: hypothetical protein KDB00_16285 [Planctomycetales bacterium]|nr:hypothetical protein [Planctomycetales bacterium]
MLDETPPSDPGSILESTESAALPGNAIQRRRVVVGLLVVLVTVFGALLLPVPFEGRMATGLGDLVHAPLFGSLALAWLFVWQRLAPLDNTSSNDVGHGQRIHQGRRLVARGAVVWISLSVFGVGMEFLQSGTGRSASRHDAIANSLGIAAAIAGYTAVWFLSQRRTRSAWGFGMLALAILAFAWWRPMMLLVDVVRMQKQFPVLASFESSEELTRWYMGTAEGILVHTDATDGEYAFQVDYQRATSPAITLIDMVPDWSEYSALEFDVAVDATNPNPMLTLLIRIIDEPHNGTGAFLHTVELPGGQRRHIRIPFAEFTAQNEGDSIDFHRMMFVDIGPLQPGAPTRIRFDRIALSK